MTTDSNSSDDSCTNDSNASNNKYVFIRPLFTIEKRSFSAEQKVKHSRKQQL